MLDGQRRKTCGRKQKIFDLWLAGWTNKDIADTSGIDEGDLSKLTKTFLENGNYAKSQLSDADHATDFETPIYNIWKQQERQAKKRQLRKPAGVVPENLPEQRKGDARDQAGKAFGVSGRFAVLR